MSYVDNDPENFVMPTVTTGLIGVGTDEAWVVCDAPTVNKADCWEMWHLTGDRDQFAHYLLDEGWAVGKTQHFCPEHNI